MSNPWLKLWAKIMHDPRILALSFDDQRHFIWLLCCKCDGTLDESDPELRRRLVAIHLGLQPRELDETARRLREVKLIDDDLNPVSWDKNQSGDAQSTDRVRRFRERKRRESHESANCNAVKRVSETSCNGVEEEGEVETETSSKEDSSFRENRESDPPITAKEVLDAWNQRMVPLGLPAVRRMTETRKRQLRARLKDSKLEDWQRAFDALERSKFLRGENDRGWRADFDFVLQPKSFTKLIEGAYDH